MKGTVKKVVVDRGFGFISETGGPDHFFHHSALAPELDFDAALEERRVEFNIVQTPRGTRAVEVRPAEEHY